MGRHALRKTDPAIDLAGHLGTFDQLPRPFGAEAIFGRAAPLEVEVGSGKGLFLRSAAAARPEVDFLGIEVVAKYAQFAAAGLAKAGLRNAMVVHADALRVFHELMADDSLAAVHVYFPDPWWKKRHKKRRVMRERCCWTSNGRCCPAGRSISGPMWRNISRPRWRCWQPAPRWRARCPCRGACRARYGLSHPFRAPRAEGQRAGIPGGVQEVAARH